MTYRTMLETELLGDNLQPGNIWGNDGARVSTQTISDSI